MNVPHYSFTSDALLEYTGALLLLLLLVVVFPPISKLQRLIRTMYWVLVVCPCPQVVKEQANQMRVPTINSPHYSNPRTSFRFGGLLHWNGRCLIVPTKKKPTSYSLPDSFMSQLHLLVVILKHQALIHWPTKNQEHGGTSTSTCPDSTVVSGGDASPCRLAFPWLVSP